MSGSRVCHIQNCTIALECICSYSNTWHIVPLTAIQVGEGGIKDTGNGVISTQEKKEEWIKMYHAD